MTNHSPTLQSSSPSRPRKLTIAIDGPAGSGKSSVAQRVAQILGYLYLDSGAMYRALALKRSKAMASPFLQQKNSKNSPPTQQLN